MIGPASRGQFLPRIGGFQSHGSQYSQPEFEPGNALGPAQVQDSRQVGIGQFHEGLGRIADIQGCTEFVVEKARRLATVDGLEQAVGGAQASAS